MTVIHDAGCCQEWETGHAATPARAESFRHAAARWGTAWPEKPQHPQLTQDYGPGKEPQSVRDAWDAHLQSQREAAPEPEAEALTRLTEAGGGARFLHPPSPALAAEPRKENRQ